jgi:hypothetical protein
MTTATVILSVVIYSNLMNKAYERTTALEEKTISRIISLEQNVKLLERIIEKRWIERLNEKQSKYRKVL